MYKIPGSASFSLKIWKYRSIVYLLPIVLLNWLSALPNAALGFWLKLKAFPDMEGLKIYLPGSFPQEATKDVLYKHRE